MPRKKREPDLPPKPKRRAPDTGSVRWVERRRRWRARLPQRAGESTREAWHLTKDEAEAWIARQLARSPDAFDPSRTVREYLDYWQRLRAGAWGPQTRRRYTYEARALAAIQGVPLWRLRGDQAQSALADLLDRGVTRRYAYNVASLLKRALADAVRWRILTENVAETISLPSPEHRVTQAWDIEEIRDVLAALVGHRFEACYLLILWGGLRIGEVVGLRWDQIDRDGGVAFRQGEQTHMPGRPLGPTKRERERETQVPLRVARRLAEIKQKGPAPVAWPGRPKHDVAYVYVAQRPDGGRWHPRTIRDDWKRLVAGLKVKQLRPHGGRRTFGTAHMVAGTPLADLATLMGHSSPATTAQSYLGSSAARRREAAERLAELLEPTKRPRKGHRKGQGDA